MGWKPIALSVVWSLVIAGYIGVFAFKATGPDTEAMIVAATGLAIGTEAGFWLTAGILGIGLLESRKRVFGMISRPFKRQ
ncbi:hypothetical protein [Henriciella sp.]|uniref:hypothetical protein n=1 Tax=Henriciella sp. TaxID=1968823 RepID=UPI0026132BB1|nr:hypothetical protein [Henriciella sp.]